MRISILLLLFVTSAAVAQSASPPRVHLVATGGTIASTNYYSDDPGKIGVEQIVRAVPGLDTIATISAQQFSNIASGSITPKMWLELSRGISDTLRAHPDLAGVVVTHGTDTMEETAYFLDLTVADPRPVVVTGAMRPSDGIGIDGPANLRDAVRVAASPSARARGTMVVMNDEIFAARDVTKSNTVRPDAFASPVRGDLGAADPEEIRFFREPQRRSLFDISRVDSLPRVDIVYSYIGVDGAGVDAATAAGARGIVVASTGRGDVPPKQREALRRAMAKGVVVVVGSRAGSGSVDVGDGVRTSASRRDTSTADVSRSEPRRNAATVDGSEPSTIGAGTLNVQKARILLMLELTKTSDPAEVAKVFRANQ
ncbi:MAG TPA: asparaginase [Gemmatimonadaceae bacterium]|nr:asparaginase [Gemmatimonadaceae bacterium]